MKIFGKRKRSSAGATSGVDVASENPRSNNKSFASDPVVQDLLKKDPSEWNAKEKRMVQRYQKRNTTNAEENRDTSLLVATINKGEETKDSRPIQRADNEDGEDSDNWSSEDDSDRKDDDNEDPLKNDEAEFLEQTKATSKGDSASASASLDLESVLETSMIEALNAKQKRKLSRTLAMHGASAVKDVIEEVNQIIKGGQTSKSKATTTKVQNNDGLEEATNVDKDDSQKNDEENDMERVKKLLNGLNSKQKRTLSRRLEREGSSCLAEVEAEAEALLKALSSSEDTPKTKDDVDSSPPPNKKRRRRGAPVDVTGLTPEERLRREEQRKMQKEAVERRTSGGEGEDTAGKKFLHPLNSERRRANKRKPKWMPRKVFANSDKIEHNASGFHVRKMKTATEQVS
jgi:hypothetical protein